MKAKLTRTTKTVLLVPLVIAGLALFVAIGGWVVMLLWNWLAPELFGLRLITFWQALGLLAICRILFGGFGMGGGGRSNSSGRFDRRVLERMAERCEQLPPEERERLRQDTYGGARTTPLEPRVDAG